MSDSIKSCQIQPLKYLLIPQAGSFHLQAIVSSICEYQITIGLSLKDTDGHGFGHLLGLPLMLKESSNCLLSFLPSDS